MNCKDKTKTLEGKFFHIFDNGRINWQGEILKEFDDGRLLIQLFSWLDGSATVQKIISASDTIGMNLYSSAEGMDAYYRRNCF